jgi:hypothetical protein
MTHQDRLSCAPPRPVRLRLAGLAMMIAAGVLGVQTAAPAAGSAMQEIKPSDADPAVTNFDSPNIILSTPSSSVPLVVFLPGTHGEPRRGLDLLKVVNDQGYRVIGLEYDDVPAVAQVCPRDPDPACADSFRRMRVDGEGNGHWVSNPAAESIVGRLTSLLKALEARAPDEGWGAYLEDGKPNWKKIVVSGLSQGAGMAAYIAKEHEVARVVLFSSPWDFTGSRREPAPWLSRAGATPPDRWYAEYNKRENTADLIQNAYKALKIPPANIQVFDLDLPEDGAPRRGRNPYHGITIRDTRYAPKWREMFGHAP